MGRPGISYHDVAKAAQQLVGENKNPTIETIRQRIGSGSSSTIAPHLRTWKTKQGDTLEIATKENLPEDFVALMKGLWQRVNDKADEQVTLMKQHHEQASNGYREQQQAFTKEKEIWEQKFKQLAQTHEQLARDKLGVEQTLISAHADNTTLKVQQESLEQHLQEKQTRIDELKQLHLQSQNNLEHYRESAREQRLMAQENNKTQQHQLEHTIQQLRQQLNELQPHHHALQHQHATISQEKEALVQQHEQLIETCGQLKIKLGKHEKQLVELTQSQQHWRSQYVAQCEKYDEQNKVAIHLQKEVAVFSEKLKLSDQEIERLMAQNKNLAHEKWILDQEKSRLLGQLDQLEMAN